MINPGYINGVNSNHLLVTPNFHQNSPVKYIGENRLSQMFQFMMLWWSNNCRLSKYTRSYWGNITSPAKVHRFCNETLYVFDMHILFYILPPWLYWLFQFKLWRFLLLDSSFRWPQISTWAELVWVLFLKMYILYTIKSNPIKNLYCIDVNESEHNLKEIYTTKLQNFEVRIYNVI